ncbi:Magnesium transport protein CorA [Rubripirellula lacrimiformis]|uniref:Magnesium transport protein CorA n=1 Tax=Rubripirellula lacrimiformis TaxID=1930273 RepID=A0A517NCF5_9BACT|nr:magnesium/cobalt transporter CorA [Rubripirellula lacrimiformis]QDT04814.1 Magnesium transport protein CorA [Rubripirellula lacrimiformis]
MNLKARFSRRKRRPTVTVGAVPGQMVAHEGSVRGRIRVIHYDSKTHTDQTVESTKDLQVHARKRGKSDPVALDESKTKSESPNQPPPIPAKAGNDVTWINVDGVGDVVMLKEISKMFGIHPLAMEDVINVHQHAKLEFYGDTMFFVARMPVAGDVEGAEFETEQVSIFLIDGMVITVQERPGDCLDPVRNRIANKLGRIRRRHADYLAYAIIDAIIDGYFPVLEHYGHKLDAAGAMLESANDRRLPLHLHEIRSDLLQVRKVVNQHRLAMNDINQNETDLITGDTALYFRDCQDHVQQLIETADTDRETCGELRELYFAMLGEKNNDVMKVLTIIATLFIPMSFVAGIYGMNFDSEASAMNMPELHWAFGYPFALGLMGLMAGGLLVFLYRKGWLS